MVIVSVNPLDSKTLRMPFALVLADIILFTRIDIRIIVEDGRSHTMGKHPLDNGG
jgi:hypothetical protein